MNILLVDDNQDILEVLEVFVSDIVSRANIETADNGHNALNLMREREFDLLVTDFEMPFVDGMTLINSLKSVPLANRPQEIVMLSAHVEEGDPDPDLSHIVFISKDNYRKDLKSVLQRLEREL